MKQYYAIKAKYPGALLLFRVGDFYETFSEDAVIASQILNITLTKRSNGSASAVELAGFPHHSLDTYLPRLVKAGKRVAICDQLEDPKSVKGIVKRGVTELVTPGVSYNDTVLEGKRNNFLASIWMSKGKGGIAFLDISTGEFLCAEGEAAYVDKLVQSFQPSEIIYCRDNRADIEDLIGTDFNTYYLDDWIYTEDYGYEKLTNHFGVKTLKGYGIEKLRQGIIAAGAILYYLGETEHKNIGHINTISRIEEEHFVWLDKFTIRNLELINSQHTDGVPLINILDRTNTPMGGRLLRKWMVLPLKNKTAIDERLKLVSGLVDEPELLDKLSGLLRPVGDLERTISKVSARRINPREILQLKRALIQTGLVIDQLSTQDNPAFTEISNKLNKCSSLLERIQDDIKEDPPLVTNQGNIFKKGRHEELDELREIAFSGKDYLIKLQTRESERTGIPKIKVAYNKVFGYYLEVSNAQKDKVPEDWIRKQTLVNAERYITEELKEYEEKILNAEGKINIIEQQLFQELVEYIVQYVDQIQQNARVLSQLDCMVSFSSVSKENNYKCPLITDDTSLTIKASRHPVIEKQLPLGESYIPNDISLDTETNQILIITGPNMAGKSALLRQVALITLMAQMGCFVPADEAQIGIVDKIFTRVGASDNLSQGESTFMVEMVETASILNNLSSRSLILMDEIGRGTSTYDGISIAWSIVEFLHNHPESCPKTLFATHYHELNELEKDLPRIKNYNVSVKEQGGKVIFMRKLQEGGTEHSFGIHVAQLAGMPNQIVFRANEVLQTLERDKLKDKNKDNLEHLAKSNYQMQLFNSVSPEVEEIFDLLKATDVNSMSPIDALLKLNEIKRLAEQCDQMA